MAESEAASTLETDSPDWSSRGGDSDVDSTLGDISSRRTESITSAAYAFRFKDGRRYHAYEGEAYSFPNDNAEQDRLDLQHHIFRIGANQKLYFAPISEGIQSALDVGTGTGIWAIDFADEHPSAAVLGIDLSPIQPAYVPVNCSFRVDNLEEEWIAEEKFDFIHTRAMIAAIKDWPKFIQQAFDHLNPGGYIEMQDFTSPVCCKNPADTETSHMVRYGNNITEAGKRIGLDFQVTSNWVQYLEQAGFVDICVKWVHWPIGPWAKGEKNKALGRFLHADFYEGLDLARLLFTGVLGWQKEEFEVLVAEARNEMRDQKVHLYAKVCFCYARKPEVPLE